MGKYVGLPKTTNRKSNEPKNKDTSGSPKSQKKKGRTSEPQFVKLNSTRVLKVKEYFANIAENAFDLIMKSGKYQLYHYTGPGKCVYLVDNQLSPLANKIRKIVPIQHCGIYLGFFKLQRKGQQMQENFFLSYEGGRFILETIKEKAPEMLGNLQKVVLDEEGEKKFLYGSDIFFNNILNDTSQLVKRRITFVFSQREEYLGLALLKVKLVGAQEYEQYKNYIKKYSRSENFLVYLMNLVDAGYYLRQGA